MVAIYDLTARQLTNAQTVYRVALPYGRDAVMGALMAAGDESSYLRYQNNGNTTRDDVPQKWRDLAAISMQFPGDAVAGEAWTTADSIGLFQQRLMYGYSSPDRDGVADLMDPAVSTVIFICGSSFGKTRAFRDSPTDMTLAQRVQWTQGSEHPDGGSYQEFEHVAEQLIERFSSVDIPTSPTPVSLTDWIPMADQEALNAFSDQIATQVGENPNIKDRVFHGWDNPDSFQMITAKIDAIAAIVGPRTSQVDGQSYSQGDFLVSVDRKLSEVLAELAALTGTATDKAV